MNAEYALAQAPSARDNQSQQKTQAQTAALQGHDADIPTETHSFTSTESFTTPTQEIQPAFSSYAPSPTLSASRNATATAETRSLAYTADAFSEAPELSPPARAPVPPSSSLSPRGHAGILVGKNDSSAGLLPSTVSQWLPEDGSSTHSEDHSGNNSSVPATIGGERSRSLKEGPKLGPEDNDPLNTTKISPRLVAEEPLSAPEAMSPSNPDDAASEPITSTKTEAPPVSVPERAPYTGLEAISSEDPKNPHGSLPEVAASATYEAPFSTDPEKVSTSTIAAPDGKRTPGSFNSDNETDLEAGRHSHDLDKKEPEANKTEVDPNIVDWDGPEDPKNPMNWSGKLKWANIAVIASITFLTPLASSMLAPAVPQVMKEFNSTNQELASFVVSVYVLGYAFGPIIIAPLSELYGRVPIYHGCNVLFIVFTVACAESTNLNMLIGWRFLQGTFGSCPLTIGGGTISDIIVQQKRGGVMAIWALGPLMGPVIGPVAGGYLAQGKGWRWVFWVIAMAAGAITIAAFVYLRESYPPVLLERKAKMLRKETGNEDLRSKLASPLSPAALFKLSIVRPMRLLFLSPIVLALSTYMAVVYGYLYLLFTTLTEVFEGQYHFSQGTVGLTYLGIGVGSLFGVIVFGFASDRILKAKAKSGEMKAEYRLPLMIPGSFLVPAGLFIYGWSADKDTFWFVPILGTGLVGVGLLATFMPIQTYLVDAFTIYAASALAANTVLRSIVGAILPLAGQKMYAKLGLGWGNSLLAFIALAMFPIPVIFYKYGERIRKNPRFQVKL